MLQSEVPGPITNLQEGQEGEVLIHLQMQSLWKPCPHSSTNSCSPSILIISSRQMLHMPCGGAPGDVVSKISCSFIPP